MNRYNKFFKEATLSAATEIDTESPSEEQILRMAITSELSAINLYQSLANSSKNENVKKLLLDITTEEKVHVGEFESLLNLYVDEEGMEPYNSGVDEMNDVIKESKKKIKEQIPTLEEELYANMEVNKGDEGNNGHAIIELKSETTLNSLYKDAELKDVLTEYDFNDNNDIELYIQTVMKSDYIVEEYIKNLMLSGQTPKQVKIKKFNYFHRQGKRIMFVFTVEFYFDNSR
jgi:rubrerythrin